MKVARHIVPRIVAWLIGIAALMAVGMTAIVFSGLEHRETVRSITREFFVLVEKASRARRAEVKASPSPTQEGEIIQ